MVPLVLPSTDGPTAPLFPFPDLHFYHSAPTPPPLVSHGVGPFRVCMPYIGALTQSQAINAMLLGISSYTTSRLTGRRGTAYAACTLLMALLMHGQGFLYRCPVFLPPSLTLQLVA